MSKLDQLVRYIKTKGVKASIRRIWQTYFTINKFVLFDCDLDREEISGPEIEKPFYIREYDEKSIEELRERNNQLPREFYIDKSHGGNRCFVVFCNDEVAHIQWIFSRGQYSRFFAFESEKVVEINYIKTIDKFTGNRLQARTISHICRVLKAEGISRVVSAVTETNVLSISAMSRSCLSPFAQSTLVFGFAKKVEV